jgi:hypothetical protein
MGVQSTQLICSTLGSAADKGPEIDIETAEEYLLEGYDHSPKFTTPTEEEDEHLVFDALDQSDHDAAATLDVDTVDEPDNASTGLAEFGYLVPIVEDRSFLLEVNSEPMEDSDWAPDTLAEAFVRAETTPQLPPLDLDLYLDQTPLSELFNMDELFAPFDDSSRQDTIEHESNLAEYEQIFEKFELQIASIRYDEKTIPISSFSTTTKVLDEPTPNIVTQSVPRIVLTEPTTEITAEPTSGKGSGDLRPDQEDIAATVAEPASGEGGPELQTFFKVTCWLLVVLLGRWPLTCLRLAIAMPIYRTLSILVGVPPSHIGYTTCPPTWAPTSGADPHLSR